MNKFCIWTPSGQRTSLLGAVTSLCSIFESTFAIFVWRALRNFATDMANVENVEEMVGTREAEAVATEPGGTVATESGGAATTGKRDGGDGW